MNGRLETYRYEVTSVEGLIQQLVVHLRNGYWFYTHGQIPAGKDPQIVDAKLLEKYEVRRSKYQRARRKVRGFYNIHYLRYQREWFLLATHGRHPLDTQGLPYPTSYHHAERRNVRDARHTPIRIHGYSLSYRRGGDGKQHVVVRIENRRYQELKAYLVSLANRRDYGWCINQIWNIPFEPYEPVRVQIKSIVREMNQARKLARQRRIPYKFIPWKRKIVKPFEM